MISRMTAPVGEVTTPNNAQQDAVLMRSDGVPLYKSARKGEEVEREPRFIRVMAFDLLGFDSPRITFRLACTKGTYVRSVAHDLGMNLGCGAHLAALRRSVSGKFDVADANALIREASDFGKITVHERNQFIGLLRQRSRRDHQRADVDQSPAIPGRGLQRPSDQHAGSNQQR